MAVAEGGGAAGAPTLIWDWRAERERKSSLSQVKHLHGENPARVRTTSGSC